MSGTGFLHSALRISCPGIGSRGNVATFDARMVLPNEVYHENMLQYYN